MGPLRWLVVVTMGSACVLGDGGSASAQRTGAESNQSAACSAQNARRARECDAALRSAETDYLAFADAPVFLPRSYLYYGTPTGERGRRQALVFGLEYALHLPVYNDLREKAALGAEWAFAFTLSFQGALRMLDEPSRPVRMPSYRPTVSAQLFRIWNGPTPILTGFRLALFHYSNGQQGCLFDEATFDGSALCRQANADVSQPSQQLNRIDGSFSTNGFIAALHGRVHDVDDHGLAIGHLAMGLELEGYLRHGPGSMRPELRALYGGSSLRFTLEARHVIGRSSLMFRSGVTGFANTSRVPKAAGVLELVWNPYWLTGIGLFVRYYGGRDFYNAFFVDSIEQFATGLAWDGERPLRFLAVAPETSSDVARQ